MTIMITSAVVSSTLSMACSEIEADLALFGLFAVIIMF